MKTTSSPLRMLLCAAAPLLAAACTSPCADVNRVNMGGEPPGPVRITGIRFENATLCQYAGPGPGNQGTDLWPIARAAHGHLYGAGGDGRGFNGPDVRGLVVTRLDGPPYDLVGSDVFRKSGVLPTGLIAVDSILYMVEQERGNGFFRIRIGKSTDNGATWTYNGDGTTDWDLDDASRAFGHSSFVSLGRDNEAVGDEFIYAISHGPDSSSDMLVGSTVEMFRAPKRSVQDFSTHQYFAGTDASGNPRWTQRLELRKPILERPDGVHWGPRMSYNPRLGRFLLALFTDRAGNLAIYEAPKPWGPWTKVFEDVFLDGTEKFGLSFIDHHDWLSNDGLTWWATFSGANQYDALNVIRATLTVEPMH